MTILSDKDLAGRCVTDGIIQPFRIKNVQPASYDFALGRTFRVNIPVSKNDAEADALVNIPTKRIIDPLLDNSNLTTEYFVEEGNSFLLGPGHFALGITDEYFKIPDDLAAKIEGKSSLGRIGLVIHSTAGWIDPGYQGTITLELGNLSDRVIKLTPGMKIGQICFLTMSSPARRPYGSDGLNSKYQFSVGPTASLLYTENPANPNVPQRLGGNLDEPLHMPSSHQDDAGRDENANADV